MVWVVEDPLSTVGPADQSAPVTGVWVNTVAGARPAPNGSRRSLPG